MRQPDKRTDDIDPGWGMEPVNARGGTQGDVTNEHNTTGERERAGDTKEK